MRVDVVVPTKDRPSLLRRTVRTLLAQRGVDVRVLVVDDASAVPARDTLPPDTRVVHLRHDRSRGAAAARDTGVAHADADLVAFCDDDDIWAPHKLQVQGAALSARPAARWSFTSAVVVDEDLRPLRVERTQDTDDVGSVLLTRNVVPGGASSVLVERSLLLETGGFRTIRSDDRPLRHAEDYAAWCRLGQGAQAAPVDLPLVAYLAHRGGKSRGPAMAEDVARVQADWQEERERRGLTVDERWRHHYVAQMHLRSGRRREGALEHWRWGLEHREVGAFVRAAVGLLYPHAQVLADRRALRRVDAAWLAQAEEWLAPVRETIDDGTGAAAARR